MARKNFGGGEYRDHPTNFVEASPDGASKGAVATVTDLSFFRSGAASIKCPAGAATTAYRSWDGPTCGFSPITGQFYYDRKCFAISALPTGAAKKIWRVGTSVLSVRMTAAGKLQLWNDRAGTQIGADSADTIALNTFYRLEVGFMVNTASSAATANDRAELRLMAPDYPVQNDPAPTVAGDLVTNVALNNVLPTQLDCGWIDAPGVASNFWIDDFGFNDDTGAIENTWLGDGRVGLSVYANGVSSSGAWRACDDPSGTSNDDRMRFGSTFLPPQGHADPGTANPTNVGHTAPFHQSRYYSNAAKTLQALMESYAKNGFFGNAIADDADSGVDQLVGNVSAYVGNTSSEMRSQRFYMAGALDRLDLFVGKLGDPQDSIVVEVRDSTVINGIDWANAILGSLEVPASAISSAPGWIQLNFGGIPTTPGLPYHFLVHRTGAVDAANCYILRLLPSTSSQGRTRTHGNLYGYSSTGPAAGPNVSLVGTLKYRAFTTGGIGKMKVVQPVVCTSQYTAPSVNVGTLASVAAPAISGVSFNWTDSGVTAGAYPTGWRWRKGGIAYAPSLRSADESLELQVIRDANATNFVNLGCHMGVLFEYQDPFP